MSSRLPIQYVEVFHLLFLRAMEPRIDRRSYIVKGGVNLRAWFASARYSEDLDLDHLFRTTCADPRPVPSELRRSETSIGTYSIHRLAPEFFGGYTTAEDSGVRLATPEKALLDVLYLTSARSRLFAHLPELTLPAAFDERETRRWIARIGDPSRRTLVRTRLAALLGRRRPKRGRR